MIRIIQSGEMLWYVQWGYTNHKKCDSLHSLLTTLATILKQTRRDADIEMDRATAITLVCAGLSR